MNNSFNAAGISEASPAWQEYISFINDIILKGFKMSSLKSLKNMHKAMSLPEVCYLFFCSFFFNLKFFKDLKVPFICINLELVENNLNFYPPLDENTHIKNLQEILFDWINMFISRGSYMQAIGKNRVLITFLFNNNNNFIVYYLI
jgi:dynein heavy chain